MPKREGNVDYFSGTPLELADKTPVTFHGLKTAPRKQTQYRCVVRRYKAADTIETFDKDGNDVKGVLPKLRNVQQSGQPRYEVIDDEDGAGNVVFYHKAEALAYANSAGLESPGQVKEVVIGEFGRALSSKIITE